VTLIGVGGIDNPDVAREKLTAGASLLQVYTGLIYEGPALVRRLVEGV
jgi:dihydroorotate dehydrogenase